MMIVPTAMYAQDQTTTQDPKAAEHYEKRTDVQSGRVANGVKSGQLTPAETANIEKHQSAINKEVAREKVANGGTLTNGEKAQVHRQMNRQSKRIADKKHNDKTVQ